MDSADSNAHRLGQILQQSGKDSEKRLFLKFGIRLLHHFYSDYIVDYRVLRGTAPDPDTP